MPFCDNRILTKWDTKNECLSEETEMEINDLPSDCLYLILGKVNLTPFYGMVASTMHHLDPCASCKRKDVRCLHLGNAESIGKKVLRSVCKKWKDVIDNRFYLLQLNVHIARFSLV